MKVAYPVIISRTHDRFDTYLVEIPDFDGFTEGYGLADAKAMAREYIGLACSELAIESIPRASREDEVDIHKSLFGNDNDSFILMIELDLNDYGKNLKMLKTADTFRSKPDNSGSWWSGFSPA